MSTTETGFDVEPLHRGPESTLLSWNGTCPESPDGSRICYTRMAKLSPSVDYAGKTTRAELWVCDADFNNHRRLFEFVSNNHNGSQGSWVDDSRFAFQSWRSCKKDHSHIMLEAGDWNVPDGHKHKMRDIRVIDVETGEVLYGPICAGIGHLSVGGMLYFAVTPPNMGENPGYPAIDEPGVYELDCDSGAVRKVVAATALHSFLESRGYTDVSEGIAHVCPNPSRTRVMCRLNMKKGAEDRTTIVSTDPEGRDMVMTENHPRPFHQLWFDDETYMAVNLGPDERRIRRYTQEGERLEVLAGEGNHFDCTSDGNWYVTDSRDRMIPLEIWLYRRGETEPTVVLDRYESGFLTFPVWSLKCHANPVFARDGRSVYYTRPAEKSMDRTPRDYMDLFKVEAVRVSIGEIIDR
jgi:hypothetical protein